MAVVWQISAIQFNEKILINGIILRNISWPDHLKTTRLKNFLLVISSYFRRRHKNKDIIISTGNAEVTAKTDKNGKFTKIIYQNDIKDISILDPDTGEPFEIIQSYPVFFPDNDNPVVAISDIDDTVLISNTQRMIKSIATVLFVTPQKRVHIDFTVKVLNALWKNGSRIFYVSKSESNLFAILTYFVGNRGLPVGCLHLTPYISFHQLFKTKGGKKYKETAIRFILDNSKDKKFILLGDDTHLDMRIYHIITKAYPGRILKIYIRKTTKHLSGTKKTDLDNLKKLPVPVVYFSDDEDMTAELNYIENLQVK